MRKILITLFLCSATSLFSQDFDRLLTERPVDCASIAQGAGAKYVDYMLAGQVDSVRMLLEYWESKCGMSEPVFRAKLLLSLREGVVDDALFERGGTGYLLNYRNRVSYYESHDPLRYEYLKGYYGYVFPGSMFDRFTREFAAYVKGLYPDNSMEYLLADFYETGGDLIFEELQTHEYDGFPLADEYNSTVDSYLKMTETHMSIIIGTWIPTGGITRLGVHPEIGWQIGWKKRRMNYDFTLAMRFLKAPNHFYAVRGEGRVPELTDYYFGGHIGFDVAYDVWRRRKHELQAGAGIAFDGMDVLKEDKNLELKGASANSYDFSFGLGYRYYVKSHWYLGLQVRYHVTDYSMTDVINFGGHPITVRFIVGGLANASRAQGLAALKYRYRE